MTDAVCNLPFERVPVCDCDKGKGPPPSRSQQLRCRLSGGPCSPTYDGNQTMTNDRELPRYKCHKQVSAAKIAAIKWEDGGWVITPADEGCAPFRVQAGYVHKHNPQPGGYYVRYEDGYESWSPAEAFEAGYTLME